MEEISPSDWSISSIHPLNTFIVIEKMTIPQDIWNNITPEYLPLADIRCLRFYNKYWNKHYFKTLMVEIQKDKLVETALGYLPSPGYCPPGMLMDDFRKLAVTDYEVLDSAIRSNDPQYLEEIMYSFAMVVQQTVLSNRDNVWTHNWGYIVGLAFGLQGKIYKDCRSVSIDTLTPEQVNHYLEYILAGRWNYYIFRKALEAPISYEIIFWLFRKSNPEYLMYEYHPEIETNLQLAVDENIEFRELVIRIKNSKPNSLAILRVNV